VSVHTLRTVNEDSILDPDDTLADVVDDREQVWYSLYTYNSGHIQ